MPDERCDLLCLDLPRAEQLRHGRAPSEVAARAAARARTLGDPTRLTLAVTLRDAGEACGCDLAWVSERAENLVSHHLRVLRADGLIASRREGKMVMHALTPEGHALLAAVLVEPTGVAH